MKKGHPPSKKPDPTNLDLCLTSLLRFHLYCKLCFFPFCWKESFFESKEMPPKKGVNREAVVHPRRTFKMSHRLNSRFPPPGVSHFLCAASIQHRLLRNFVKALDARRAKKYQNVIPSKYETLANPLPHIPDGCPSRVFLPAPLPFTVQGCVCVLPFHRDTAWSSLVGKLETHP